MQNWKPNPNQIIIQKHIISIAKSIDKNQILFGIRHPPLGPVQARKARQDLMPAMPKWRCASHMPILIEEDDAVKNGLKCFKMLKKVKKWLKANPTPPEVCEYMRIFFHVVFFVFQELLWNHLAQYGFPTPTRTKKNDYHTPQPKSREQKGEHGTYLHELPAFPNHQKSPLKDSTSKLFKNFQPRLVGQAHGQLHFCQDMSSFRGSIAAGVDGEVGPNPPNR